ncbi:MAG: MFS transporter [Beijerinckiaceae bacterium]|nr:MFS transporter [Beijerinckiaceae bacterium]
MRHAAFRNVWLASLSSNFGGLIQSVGASWMMASIATSAGMVALVQTSTTLPIMIFSLAAGAIADNYDRRKVMIFAQLFMLAMSVVLTATAFMGLVTPWLLLTLTFLIGCGNALNGPAWQSSVGDMVPRADLPAAVTLNSMGFNAARSIGPAIGGLIVAAAGAATAFAVNAVSYSALIFVLMRWKPVRAPRFLPPESLGLAMAAGIRYVAMSPAIKTVLLRCSVFGLAASCVQALMPIVARDLVQGGPVTFGLLLGGFGGGAVAGAFISGRLRSALSVERLVRCAFLGFALCAGMTATSSSTALTMLAMAIGGACWVLALSTFNVAVQMSAPRWVVGRSLALYQTAAFGAMALGSWLWGLLAERYGPAEALWISAAVHVLGAAIGFMRSMPDMAETNLDPLQRWTVPDVAVPIQPRSGPVIIKIEYTISREDVPEFLSIMAERRRVRRRDGARHWTLLRDLADPEVWIERYHTPTWLEYIRHNQRITHADAKIGERLRELHRGGEPRVQRMIERQIGSLPSALPEMIDPVHDAHGST